MREDYEEDYYEKDKRVQQRQPSRNRRPKTSGLSITAFVFSLLGCLSIVGLILGIVDLTKNDGRKKGLSIAAVVISVIMFILTLIIAVSGSSDKKELKSVGENTMESSGLVVDNSSVSVTNSGNNSSNITINEQVLVDRNGVKITAVEFVSDAIWGDGIKMLLENNTDRELMYSCDALIVNDYMISDLFVQSVTPGNSAYETLYLSNSELKQAGIDNVGKIEIYFRIYDNNTWEDVFKTDCITLQTSDYSSMDTTANISGQELYNKNGIRIVAQYVDEDSFWGKAILLYAENNTSQNITISADNLSVNGFMFSPMYVDTIYAGKKSINDITLFSSELEQNNVTEIRDVEINFRIYNPDNFNTIDETGTIKFSVN